MEIINIKDKRYQVNYKSDNKIIEDYDIVKLRTRSNVVLKNDNIVVFANEIKEAIFEEKKQGE